MKPPCLIHADVMDFCRDYLDNVAASNTEEMSIAQFLFLCMALCGIGAFILTGINCRNAELDAHLSRIERTAGR